MASLQKYPCIRMNASFMMATFVLFPLCACDQRNPVTKTDAGRQTAETLEGDSGATSAIALIQGTGKESTVTGSEAEVTGVVTATFFERGELGGFFVQDASPSKNASNAIFVGAIIAGLQAGETVKVSGVVAEIDGMTAIKPRTGVVLDIERLQGGGNVDPVPLPPLEDGIEWESYESMLVTAPYPMYVVDTYDLARRGRIVLASERQRVPTDLDQPDRERFRAAETKIRSTRITLDDGITSQNRFPIPLIPDLGTQMETLRFGSQVNGLTGVVTESDGDYYLIPTTELKLDPQLRPERPSVGEANVVVTSFNVLNFFTTIDNGSNGARGADNEQELERQRAKLVAAILGLQADVIGLMELENSLVAENELIRALNQEAGSEIFAGCGLPSGFAEAPGGGDKIRVGILYRKDRVTPVHPIEMISDPAFVIARTPLVQDFRRVDSEQSFSLIVNHFKSKGAREAQGKDRDQKDGQAAYNAARTRQAEALVGSIKKMVDSGQTHVLVIGDLNAYRFEDPIDTLRDAGLVDLMEAKCTDEFPYTFIYYGQAGSLDHSFATASLAERVTGVEPWHINAAEPRFLDYNTEFNPKSLFQPDAFRSSDHDPVLIGLDLK